MYFPCLLKQKIRKYPYFCGLLLFLAVTFAPPEAIASGGRGLVYTGPVLAYVGPGAGFAFLAGAMALVVTIIALIFGVLLWPFRLIYRLLTWKRTPRKKKIKRAVIVGLDGLDPAIVRRLFSEDRLPNLKRLKNQGTFAELDTTYPAMSPVAWSSFATGTKPCKHGIFDFFEPDPSTYLPVLSSAQISPPRRHLKVGGFKIPLGKPGVRFLRRSQSFWKILAKYRVPCSILRVPITFPPEKFAGTLLSAMCTPDLLGTQGTYTLFTSHRPSMSSDVPDNNSSEIPGKDPSENPSENPNKKSTESADSPDVAEGEVRGEVKGKGKDEGGSEGRTKLLKEEDGLFIGTLEGPNNPMRERDESASLELTLRVSRDKGSALIRIGGETITARLHEYTPWVKLKFPLVAGLKARGGCRFRLLETEPHVKLYVTPLNLHPENPAMPISTPSYFSVFLSKLTGPFATLGLAEDTWARNENVLDDRAFLEQAADIHEERERMFFEMVKRTDKGLVTCVFDTTDRVQHMFMRQDVEHRRAGNSDDDSGESLKNKAESSSETSSEVSTKASSKTSSEVSTKASSETSSEVSSETRLSEAEQSAPQRRSLHHALPHKAVDTVYERMDEMLGKLFKMVDIEDNNNLVMVISDHGFKGFRRGINLNAWLHENGYLALKNGEDGSKEWLKGVDWENTKAYSMGLAGIYINTKGRERHGTISPGDERDTLAREIADKLTGLKDDLDDVDQVDGIDNREKSTVSIRKAYPANEIYSGPYASKAPDIIVGYAENYRASWSGAKGCVKGPVFTQNDKAWSGDHCIDPSLVPGVLFANKNLEVNNERPRILDIAPTMLSMFGIPKPAYMDGEDLTSKRGETS